jgi:RsiW-degrading membrane proteinase PrsW (M82 family)
MLLAIGCGAGGLLALAVAASTLLYAAFNRWLEQPEPQPREVLTLFVVASSLTLICAVLLMTSFRAWQFLRGLSDPTIATPALRLRDLCILLVIWVASSVLAQTVVPLDSWRWAAPLLHLAAIGAPVYLLLRLGIGGIQGGSRLRLWGSVATGLVLGTGLAAVVEIGLLLLGGSVGAAYLVFNPESLQGLESLALRLGQASGMEEMLSLLQPLLARPFALLVVLTAVSGVAPIVEELAKSSVAWMLFDRLSTGAQGFWCGALAGAGFALFEGLIASADAAEGWTFVLMVRAASSLMHILASALAGWGIASFRLSGKAAHMLGGYAISITLHALWNASVVAIAFGGLRLLAAGSALDVVGVLIGAAGGSGLMALLVLMPIALVALNRRLMPPQPAPASGLVASDAE